MFHIFVYFWILSKIWTYFTSIPVTMGTLNNVRRKDWMSKDAANTTPIPTLKIPLEAWTAWRHANINKHHKHHKHNTERCLKVSYSPARGSLPQKVVQNRFDSRQRFTGTVILHQRLVIWTSAVCRILMMMNVQRNICTGHLKRWILNDVLKISHKTTKQKQINS